MPYIYNESVDATGNADFNLQSYTELGIPAGATITLVQPLARVSTAVSVAQNTNVAVRTVSNPTVAELSYPIVSTEALNETTGISGWKSFRGTTSYNPVVTRGTRPVVRVGKRTATDRVAMVDLVGAYIEYNDEVSATQFETVNQAVQEVDEAGEYRYLIDKTLLVNQVTQTQTALSVTPAVIQTHNKILGQPAITETAQPLESTGSTAINQVIEEDNATGLARTVTKTFIGSA